MNLAIIAKPLSWVTVVGIDVGKRDWEVDEVEIEVVKTPILELSLRRYLDLTPHSHLVGVTLDQEQNLT